MGQTPSAYECVRDLRYSARAMEERAAACEKASDADMQRCRASAQRGHAPSQRQHAESSVRNRAAAGDFLRMGKRAEAMAIRIDFIVHADRISRNMRRVVSSMNVLVRGMSAASIARDMTQLDAQFDAIDVAVATLDGGMQAVTALGAPESDVDALMRMVDDETHLGEAGAIDAGMAQRAPRVTPSDALVATAQPRPNPPPAPMVVAENARAREVLSVEAPPELHTGAHSDARVRARAHAHAHATRANALSPPPPSSSPTDDRDLQARLDALVRNSAHASANGDI